jgi:RNA polymerase sigma factor (sigma-70 family)
MKIGRGLAVQRQIGQLFDGQSVAGLGEVQLLERFVDRHDEPAFAALVARHGPMVLGVCRRLLADPLDVEDAFQATFLVLVRRAGSLRDRDRLAPWLFGVARRVAARARADLARRRDREGPGVDEIADREVNNPARELGRALVEEIDRLPSSLREPILLCCVEDLSYDEAADRLGSTAPAIRGRLARARIRLRDRLTRRGFAPTIAALGALLTAEASSAAVPSRLLLTTIQVAKAGAVPAGVGTLAEGVIRTMILTKSKILAAAVVACGVAGSSMGVSAQLGGEAGRNRVEDSRLDQVEKKLDRVLEALEGKAGRPTAETTRSLTFAPAVPPVPPVPPEPSEPSEHPTNVSTTRTVQDGVEKQLTTVVVRPDTPRSRNLQWMGGKAPDSARLDALEQKLQALEARLLKLEQRLEVKPASADEAPKSDVRPPALGR